MWSDRSARVLLKLSFCVSVRTSQAVQAASLMLGGAGTGRAAASVGAHQTLTFLGVYLTVSGSSLPGYLHLYDALLLNLGVQVSACLFSYTSILLSLLILCLLRYSLTLQQVPAIIPPRPIAIRRKYSKHKH